MSDRNPAWLLALIVLVIASLPVWSGCRGPGVAIADSAVLTGRVFDSQGQPVEGARVTLRSIENDRAIMEATTQADGSYGLAWPDGSGDTHEVSAKSPPLS